MFTKPAKKYIGKTVSDGYSHFEGFKSPLYQAVATNDLDAVKAILEEGKNPEHINQSVGLYDEDTPLLAAVRNNNLAIVRLLVQHGASLSKEAFHERYQSEGNRVSDGHVTAPKYAERLGRPAITCFFNGGTKEEVDAIDAREKLEKFAIGFLQMDKAARPKI